MTQGKDRRDRARQPSPPATPRKLRRKPEAAFDLWLERGLHQLFDDVAKEPIPDELLKVIEDDKQQT